MPLKTHIVDYFFDAPFFVAANTLSSRLAIRVIVPEIGTTANARSGNRIFSALVQLLIW